MKKMGIIEDGRCEFGEEQDSDHLFA